MTQILRWGLILFCSSLPYRSSKITPSLFTIKEGSTPHLGLLPSGEKRETALLGARNRYALRLADQSGLRHIVRDGTAGGQIDDDHRQIVRDGTAWGREFTIYNLQLIVYSLLIGRA